LDENEMKLIVMKKYGQKIYTRFLLYILLTNYFMSTFANRNSKKMNMAPMWDADGKLLPFNTFDDDNLGKAYRRQPLPMGQNGRVIGVSEIRGHELSMFTENNNRNDTFKKHALYGIQNRSPLSDLFFSKANMGRIQDLLRYRVYVASGGKYKIGPQSSIELEIIMKAMFLQHAKHLPSQMAEQINELNRLVVEYAWPKVLSEVEQYIEYCRDLENLPVPIDLPKNVSSKGTRTLSSVTSTF
jgi:hypothetical protein